MIRIGLISDTHGHFPTSVFKYFEECDEIWHAGDVGSLDVVDRLQSLGKTVRGVYGNIDDAQLRRTWPQDQRFSIQGLRFWITHIAGPAGRLPTAIKNSLRAEPADVLICGHSHILQVGRDPSGVMCINPGACGVHGFHKVRTMLRFTIEAGQISDLAVIELGARGALKP